MGHIRSDQFATIFLIALGSAVVAGAAPAAVVISSDATQNMSCANGVCTPTATKAVLNAGDLETMLASGSVTVTTTGSGVQAKDIDVKAAVSWSSSNGLTLDAYRSATIDQPVSVQGLAALTLTTNDGGSNGTLLFGKKGNVTFANLSSALTINGTSYALENSIKSLAAAIANNPSGDFALANSYDASQDGTYTTVPIPTLFGGTFEGLDNIISNLSISDATDTEVGLFSEINSGGSVRDLGLTKATVAGTSSQNQGVGAIAGGNLGTIMDVFATGSVSTANGEAGGLVDGNDGTIAFSHASVDVAGPGAGGLAGTNANGTIMTCYATGKVFGGGQIAGGLVGTSYNQGANATVSNSYALGRVSGGNGSDSGGFAGENDAGATINDSYSIGAVKKGGFYRGGFVGYDGDPGDLSDSYWDTETSHVKNLKRGAGNRKDDPGISGLTTEQLQSGLPPGFDPKIWGQNVKINNGLPYLLANPPR